jgi:hypothetical protein
MEHIHKETTPRNKEHHMSITHLVHEPIKLEHVAVREAAHKRALRVTRGMTPRRAAASMTRASLVVAIQPDREGSSHDVRDERWCNEGGRCDSRRL